MQAARLHEYTEEMDDALAIDDVDAPQVSRADHVVVDIEGQAGARRTTTSSRGCGSSICPRISR